MALVLNELYFRVYIEYCIEPVKMQIYKTWGSYFPLQAHLLILQPEPHQPPYDQRVSRLRNHIPSILQATARPADRKPKGLLRWMIPALLFLLLLPAQRCPAQSLDGRAYPRPRFEDFWKHQLLDIRSLARTDTVTVSIIGDVMMHAKQLPTDWTMFLRHLEGMFAQSDLCIANMEFPLGGKPYRGYPSFSTPDDFPPVIRDSGIDVFLCANNHVLDKGSEGLRRTIGKYGEMEGILFTGISADSEQDERTYPLIVPVRGLRLALVNFTYGTNSGPSEEWPKVNLMKKDDIARAIRRAREKGADYIIALPHWGVEYELHHSESQMKMARWLVEEQGCDAVVGAHPHVVQDSCRIRGRSVFFSLGNAVSNMSVKNTRLELMVTLRIQKNADGSSRMLEPRVDFLWCTLPGKLTDSYATIPVEEFRGRRDLWMDPSDYDNMIESLDRVKKETGIKTDR